MPQAFTERRHRPSAPTAARHRGGFTLIELLVVLAIVATLLMLVTPRYQQQLAHSRESVLRENLRVTRAAIDRFHGDVGRYPDSLQELVQRRYLRSLPYDPLKESAEAWELLPPAEGEEGAVADLRSSADGEDAQGQPYASW